MVASTTTVSSPTNESKTAGQRLKTIEDPKVLQPIGIGMKKDEPTLLAKVHKTLLALDQAGEINQL
ncbi:hypothetical protein ML401_36600 (plasmid) [Bradyrhizobium sp. 62B]|uniref:hypothetical protein n=1 Tax=Bradyrhizobium sp. 62B TaxID=2898442 RepID=UPI0025580BB0|nr:hypothetical protein ML401_36600 [Bradyrhizobium sp. 62B]